MKPFFLSNPLPALLLALLCCIYHPASAQVSRSKNTTAVPYDNHYTRIGTGNSANHSFEIRNGALWGWGLDIYSQLGDASAINKTTPVLIGAATNWVTVACGSNHTIALRSDGTLWGAGVNGYGVLGDGTTTGKTSLTATATGSTWISVACGVDHTMALKSDGTLWAWGNNSYGQLGDGTTTGKNVPTAIAAGSTWTSIACGGNHTLAIKSDGSLWAWGQNTYGQIGDASTTQRASPVPVAAGTTWLTVAGGYNFTVAIKSDGTLWAWGNNSNYQLGDGTTINRNVPTSISTGTTWKSVSGGAAFAAAIRSDGGLYTWGFNGSGQLGNGGTASNTVPTQLASGGSYVSMMCGSNHMLGVKSDGTLMSWGTNSSGQLGDGTTTSRSLPVLLQNALPQWLTVASGDAHQAMVKGDGTLWTVGGNTYRQLGDGTVLEKHVPIQIGTDKTWTTAACGYQHSLALKNDGSLWAWGTNTNGQLGDGTTADKSSPVQIAGTWASVACGYQHTMGIKSDGTLWAWGLNNYGQLGDGSLISKTAPVQIAGTWLGVACGQYHTLAISADGKLYSWGYNGEGELGDGTYVNKVSPAQIGIGSTWLMISCGASHSLALKTNGTLWTWGYNGSGQLGDGSLVQKPSITAIAAGTTWVRIAGGLLHSNGIRADGQLMGWGFNGFGQLGDGTTADKTSPLAITGQGDIVALTTGLYGNTNAVINATRSSICVAGNDGNGQLADGGTTSTTSYNCSNNICAAYSLATGATTFVQPMGGSGNRTDFQSSCALGAALSPTGITTPLAGNVTLRVLLDASVASINGHAYVQRHYDILPATNAQTSTATVTLYFTQSEFTTYNANNGSDPDLPTGPADNTGIANLRITQYHRVPSGGYAATNYPATWTGSGPVHLLITPTSVIWNSIGNRWEVTFPGTGFSGFFVSGNPGAPLPLKLQSFSAQKAGSRNRIDWQTATETEGYQFDILRSGTGAGFMPIGTVPGVGKASGYLFYDEQPLAGINYYQLKMTGTGGEISYSSIAIIRGAAAGGSITIAPQPATNSLTINSTLPDGGDAAIYDMQGRELAHFAMRATQTIDMSAWAAGIYNLRLSTGDAVRIVKQ